MTIRERRRDRTRKRLDNQKRLDAIAYKELNGNMMTSFDTWGGTRCPDCNKPLPARAFCAGYHTGNSQIRFNVGTSVNPEFCHDDKSRCHSESAKHDPSTWKLANDYIPTKKELKKWQKHREYLDKKYKESNE